MSLAGVIAALDRAIDSALTEKRIIGCAVLLAEAGRVIHARHAGLADREAGVAIYELTHKGSGKVNNYEVVIIRQHKADNDFIKVKAGDEYLPSTSEWGQYGWTFPTLELANYKAKHLIHEHFMDKSGSHTSAN